MATNNIAKTLGKIQKVMGVMQTPNQFRALLSNEVLQGHRMLGRTVFQDVQSKVMSTNFGMSPNSEAGVVSNIRSVPIKRVGWLPEYAKDVPPQFRIVIEDRKEGMEHRNESPLIQIYAVMQDATNLSVESAWETFPALEGALSEMANIAAQALVHRSLVSRFSSRRYWKGTEPIQIKLTMRFEAIQDAFRDVIEPTLQLQQLALPTKAGLDWGGAEPLNPPGPSPFKLPNMSSPMDRGEEITIKIGRFLLFSSVIVKSASVSYDTRVDINGSPISAVADMTFQTYSIFTKENLKDAYALTRTD